MRFSQGNETLGVSKGPLCVVAVRSVHQLPHLTISQIELKCNQQAQQAKLAVLYTSHPLRLNHSRVFQDPEIMSTASAIHIWVNATSLHPPEHIGSQFSALMSAGM